MGNPISEMREKLGLTPSKFSILMGVNQAEISKLEHGYASRLSPRILERLYSLGFDAGEVLKVYRAWREEKAKEIEESIKDRLEMMR